MLNYQSMGPWFIVHRYLPGIVFLLASYFYYKNKNLMAGKPFAVLALLAIIQICFGALNIVLTLPSWSQVIHIVLGSFLPVYAFYYCIVKPGNELEEASILES
jgi:heme A synthase